MKKTIIAAKELRNIPDIDFNAPDSQYEEKMTVVKMRSSGVIELSRFALFQVLMGASVIDLLADTFPCTTIGEMAKYANFIGRLYAIPSQHPITWSEEEASTESPLILVVTRQEVEWMRKLLEARMEHCEEERDNRSPKFNPDTYIAQKLLLIELREWLMVTPIISISIEARVAPREVAIAEEEPTSETKYYQDAE